MILNLQEAASIEDLDYSEYDIGFYGPELDDRGKVAIDFVKEISKEVKKLKYDAENMVLFIDEDFYNIDDLEEKLHFLKDKKILIESTTLTFTEVLLLLKQLKKLSSSLSILYIEPKSYRKKRAIDDNLVFRRQYDLSDVTIGYRPIPGFSSFLSLDMQQRILFLAGYESERVDRAIEENSIITSSCSLLFGVPAFQAGWEMNSFTNNVRIMKERGLSDGVHFASANNPGAVYDELKRIYRSLDTSEEFYIVPIGTKPCGIGAALFMVDYEDVNVLYDHPSKTKTRSKEINKWHMYDVEY